MFGLTTTKNIKDLVIQTRGQLFASVVGAPLNNNLAQQLAQNEALQ